MSTTSTDPIADMLSRIRNAIAVSKNEISMPHSKSKETIAQILVSSGFVSKQSSSELDGRKNLVIVLNDESENSPISSISRMSKPGQRRYVKSGDIPTIKRGRGMVIISTSSGVMTGAQAKAKNLGGELICEVY